METTVRLVKVIVFRNCDVSVLDIFFFGGGVPWTVDSPLQRAKQTPLARKCVHAPRGIRTQNYGDLHAEVGTKIFP